MARSIFIPAILILAFFSCRKAKSNITPIDSKVVIDMKETLDSNGMSARHLVFSCATTKIYPCSNDSIVSKVTMNGNNISVVFSGVFQPTQCYSSMMGETMNAKSTMDLGHLSNGTYTLTVTSRTTTTIVLSVSDSAYTAVITDTTSCSFKNNMLNKVPVNTIWGYINSRNISPVISSFFDSLMLIGATQFAGPAGNYYYFNNDAAYFADQISGDYHKRNFVYHYPGNYDAFKTLVKNYGSRTPDSLWIYLYNDKGMMDIGGYPPVAVDY